MANHGQLELLTSTQAGLIDTLAPIRYPVAEFIRINWPSPTGAKLYSWWDCSQDSAYSTPLTAWRGSVPVVVGLVGEPGQRFADIPRTSAIGDDVIQIRVDNHDQAFETLCYTHRGGVKVEVFYFFPTLANDATGTAYTAISWFLGHLRTPDECNADYVSVTIANGFRSPQLLLPNRPHASNCTFYFGGELTASELVGNGCDYDRHVSGTRGTLNGGSAWTSCPHTKSACLTRMGDTLSYGGDDTVIESTLIGLGNTKTVSTTVGNETRLKEPVRVVYGERKVRALHLLAYAKEYNPSEDNQDQGTLRTLFEVSEGPIQSISEVKVMEKDLPRPDGLGLEKRLGTQQQSATTFSPNVHNYNRRAHFRGDLNPIDPNGIQVSDITGECKVTGRNTIRVYTDESTYTQQYTNLRAWCFLDLLIDQNYGHRMDKGRFKMSDFIYLAGKASTFNADVQGRTVQQQVYDICLAGLWYLPFNYNGYTRVLPIEEVDFTQIDIPEFTDALGSTCNILWDRDRNTSRLRVSYRDDDQIPNSVIMTVEDEEHDNIERPLTFEDWTAQYRAGTLYGDKSKRKVEAQYAAYGLTNVDDATVLGQSLLETGPFGTGGTLNNCTIEFAVDALSAEALNLHENKVIKVTSSKLTPYEDEDGNPFEYFLIQSLYRTSSLELIIRAQAYRNPTTCPTTSVTLDLCGSISAPSAPYGSVSFDNGSAVYVLGGLSTYPNTISFWVKLDTDRDARTSFASRPLLGGAPWFVGTSTDGTTLTFYNGTTDTTGSALNTVTWYHVAVVSASGSGASRKVYLNGVLDITATGNASTLDMYFGNDLIPGTLNLDGKMAAIKIWTAELTADEIADEMLAYGPCKTDSLWAWFPLYSTATALNDYSENCRTLTTEGTKSDSTAPQYGGSDIDFYCTITDTESATASGYVQWNTPDDDVIDGPNGVSTRILSATADRSATGTTYPSTIDTDSISTDTWTHTIYALPSNGHSYDVHHDATTRGFKVWYDGSAWIYYDGGTDTSTLAAGALQAGDTLSVTYTRSGGTRVYKKNSTTLRTDTGATPMNDLIGVCNTTGDTIGDVAWSVTYDRCTSVFEVSPVGQSGGSTTATSATPDTFDVLGQQVNDRPEDYLQSEMFG